VALASIRGSVLTLLLTAPVLAQSENRQPLARHIPSDGLAVLVEHDGFETHGDAWNGTATYKMLHETGLGAMLKDIATQVAERAFQAAEDAPLSGKELIGLLAHVADKGFAIGYAPDPRGRQPRFLVAVVRDAADSEVFKTVLGRIPQLNEPAARRIAGPGGRRIWVGEDPRLRWWYEKKDFVFSLGSDPDSNPAADAFDGKISSALKNSRYASLAKLDAGRVPTGRLMVDLSALPPLPPRAGELGLDGVRRIEARWGIQGKGIVVTLGVSAPRPRRGILALFDQPPLKPGTSVVTPGGQADYALMSVDPVKFADTVLALVKQHDPDSAEKVDQLAERFRDRTGVNLREDVLAKIGPRMAFLPATTGVGNVMAMWFHPPDFGLVAELKDPRSFVTALDRLIEAANRQLKSAGALVPAQEGQPARPGTEFAEFRRLKAGEHGYVLSVPPSVLPTPAGLRPTVIVDRDRGLLALAGSPAAARRVLSALKLEGNAGRAEWERDGFVFAQSDQSGTLPELLVNLPSIVQFIGYAATQQPAPMPNPGVPGMPRRTSFRLELDPDSIPDAEQLRPYLFPSRYTLAADNDSIRWSSYQAFPLPAPSLTGGMETPVLIALLLPAVQSAREAARRAQCVNNLKQISLALLNYESANGAFPASAVKDTRGKPLLSWRVQILPYLEQKPLYDKFRQDEPWDSPHNKELLKYMPMVYACPSRGSTVEAGMTHYRAFVGRGTAIATDRGARLADITDGTSNTITVVESRAPVPWTKPDELPFDENLNAPAAPLFGAGSMHPGGFNAAFADGSIHFLKLSINPRVLHALITRSGGEVVTSDSY
jgi:prepilin-type processing-associated H-X9-DG protein